MIDISKLSSHYNIRILEPSGADEVLKLCQQNTVFYKYTSVRLAIGGGNPRSLHFWKKNGFDMIKGVDVNGWTKLVAEKSLNEG